MTNIKKLFGDIHRNAVNKGFWDNPREIATSLCLIHSEVSEAMEIDREVGPHNDEFASELADIVIRTIDLAEYLGLDLLKAIITKHEKNTARPKMHGNKRY